LICLETILDNEEEFTHGAQSQCAPLHFALAANGER
jgi:hypothetical protein